jgi:hypothetical protein
MKIALLNGSPKGRGGVSGKILSSLAERLPESAELVSFHIIKQDCDEIIAGLRGCDAVVFAFPLYVDSLPSHLIRFLEIIQNTPNCLTGNNANNGATDPTGGGTSAMVYALVNNGFYEARQNATAIEMMKRFCARSGLVWGRAAGIGAGGMISGSSRIGYGPFRSLGRTLDAMAGSISASETGGDLYVEPNFPRFLYIMAGHAGWKRAAKKNNLSVDRLYGGTEGDGDTAPPPDTALA